MSQSYGQKTKPVIACLDGGDDGDRALRYAIEEAQRRDTGVRLVHVPPDVVPCAPMTPLYSTPSLREIGAHILKDALEVCLEVAPELYVAGSLVTGPRVPGIVKESKSASAVVLGTRKWKGYRVFGGSTSVGVAARAHCPVIAVPPVWTPGRVMGKVVVGVDAMAGPAPVLVHAFEAARIRRAELLIVHSWTARHPYAPASGSFDAEEWRKAMESWLAQLTAAIRAEYPDVEASHVASFSVEPTELPRLARDSDLLVIGRHRHSTLLMQRLGSVAQHALHAGTSPIEIIEVGEQRT